MVCSGSSEAKRRYRRDSWRWMVVYMVLVLVSALMVRSLLCAIAGTLGVSWYASMVRGFGGTKALPPFTEFAVFWVLFGAVQTVQVLAYRVRQDA